MKTVFLRALEAEDKAAALLGAIQAPETAKDRQRFEVDPTSFSNVPRSPFAYWVSERMRELFTKLPAFEDAERTAKCGMGTLDDFRFLRLQWELPHLPIRGKWQPYVKGGRFSRYYADVPLCVLWSQNGAELKVFVEAKVGSASRKIQATSFYFRPGLTWPLRGIQFSAQAVPAGCIFSVGGKMAFIPDDKPTPWLALFNAEPFDKLIAFFAGKVGGVQYEVGLIQQIPVPHLTATDENSLATLARRAWSLKRLLDTRTEASHAFTLPALLQVKGTTLAERSAAWTDRIRSVEAELSTIQSEIDARCFDLYGIDMADRRAITEGFGSTSAAEGADVDSDAEDAEDAEDAAADATTLGVELMAWAVGVAFGRFDVRIATSERAFPAEPEPFDALPVCSPAMLTGDDGLPLTKAPAGYPLTLPEGGLLVHDAGHPLDLTTAVRAVFDVVFGGGDLADARWNEAAALLDPRDRDVRNWLAKGFFEHHLRRHSKSRRKAPIVWQLATPSASYAVWLYAHRLTKDSLVQVQNDFVVQKLAHEERKQRALASAAGSSPSASQRKEIAAQDALIEELSAMLQEVKRIAPLWNPDLDDGVVLTMAPLWRLVPQHKAWQKELRTAWDGLCAGKFDWSRIAMHLWPERVVPKCATDRSLAIAHGLEKVFWSEGSDGKWKPRKTPTKPLAELIRERTSPAVKAALQSLVDVPRSIERSLGPKRRRK